MQVTIRYSIAFLLLCLLVQEAHEIAHMTANKLLNGCGGVRYFLYWQLCDTGDKYSVVLTAFAGPLINFLFMWCGYKLLAKNTTVKEKSYGFTFIMATLPLQRLQAFVFRGSDEIIAVKKLMPPAEPFKGAAVLAGLMLILVLMAPPLYRAFKYLEGKNKWFTILAFLFIPFFVGLIFQHLGANESIRAFLLSSPGVSQQPSWLALLDIVLLLLFIFVAKSVGNLFTR